MHISEFFANKSILITGGTGFIGKAAIEKLLRSCPDIGNIYVLVRTKRGKSPHERFDGVLKDPAFRYLWKDRPEVFQKIQLIKGDCTQLGLGLSSADVERLSNVEIIIHSAASVRFDEPLREAILLNSRSTYELLKIAIHLKNLKAFVHISTTYSNPAETIVKEEVYPENIYWRDALKLAENCDAELLNIFTPKISSRHPNTYTFTKNLSEQIVNEFRKQIPIIIFRPSIVISSLEEPIPGWIDNVNGPIGTLVASGIGLKRCDICDPEVILAVIPIDIVIRSMLVATYKLGTRKNNASEVENVDVYNCAVSGVSPLNIRSLISGGEKAIRKYPFERTLWSPGGMFHQYKTCYLFQTFFQQFLIALIIDSFLRLGGRKPMVTKIQRLIINAGKVLLPFMHNTWYFKTEKFFGLEESICESDKKDFSFLSLCYINYEEYYIKMIAGMREFILKEPIEASSKARLRMKILTLLNYCICAVTMLWIMRFVFRYLLTLLS